MRVWDERISGLVLGRVWDERISGLVLGRVWDEKISGLVCEPEGGRVCGWLASVARGWQGVREVLPEQRE